MRNIFGLLGAAVLLNGCLVAVESASLAVNENDRLDANLNVAPPTKLEADPASQSRASPYQRTPEEVERSRLHLEQMRNCIAGSVSEDVTGLEHRIIVRDQTEQQLQEAVGCFPLLSDYVEIDLNNSDGFFWSTKVLSVTARLPVREGRLYFPNRIVLEMPRNIEATVAQSSPAVIARLEPLDDNRVALTFEAQSDVVRAWTAEQGGRDCFRGSPCPFEPPFAAPVIVTAESTSYKFGLGEVLAFFSILFGSGIAVTVGSRVLAVRTENKDKSRS